MRLLLLIVTIAFALIGCDEKSPVTQARVDYWEQQLSNGFPIGSNKDAIAQWGVARGIKFDYLEKQQELYANVERVPDNGIVCSQWNIIIVVNLDSNNRSTKQAVHTVGSCL